MNLKQFEYFLEFSKCKSISQAAEHLYLTQQGLSKALHTLEKELGYPLFQQNNGKITLTQYGELLTRHCTILVEDVHQMQADLERARLMEPQVLHINIAPIIRLMLPFNINHEFTKVHPKVCLYEGNFLDLEAERMLLTGKFDALIGLGPVFDARLTATKLFSYPACAVIRRSHPLAMHKSLTLQELCSYPLVLVNEKYKTISLFLLACEQQGLKPNIVTRSPSSSVLYRVCLENDYVGLSYYEDSKRIYDTSYAHIPVEREEFCFQGFLIRNPEREPRDSLNQYLRF
ncbi:MAG: LysR family transcriptional regulator, partial [Oscillospiraceae bacterium]|nr:LysR family transcriptional regulator [Oscillospiraceae bacterium]